MKKRGDVAIHSFHDFELPLLWGKFQIAMRKRQKQLFDYAEEELP